MRGALAFAALLGLAVAMSAPSTAAARALTEASRAPNGGLEYFSHVFPVAGAHWARGPIGEFGAPRSGGRTHEGFDIVAAVPAACTDDKAAAYAAMRRDLLPYFGLPFYRAMLERSGFGDAIAAFDAAGGDPEAMQAAIPDAFLDVLTAVGSEDEVRAGVQRYTDAGAVSPCVGPIPKTDYEATLRAAAPA